MSIDETLADVLRCSGDFKELLLLAGLDPSRDLRGCDFSNVDFGDLSAQNIDLSHCNLFNADLRKVQGRLILHGAQYAGAKLLPEQITSISSQRFKLRARFDLIKRAIIAVHRFQLQFNIGEQLRSNFDSNAPIVAIYRSPVERDRLQEEIRNELSKILMSRVDRWPIVGGETSRARFIEVRSGSKVRGSMPANREAADLVFFHSLLDSKSEALIDVSVNPRGEPPIIDHTSYGNSIDSRSFSRFSALGIGGTSARIRREAFDLLVRQQTKDCLSAIFFNDTTLFSSDMAEILRKGRNKCRYVFLLNRDFLSDPVKQSARSAIWPRFFYMKPRVMLNDEDLKSFVQTFKPYEEAGLFLSESTRLDVITYRGRPARELKNMMIGRLREVLNDGRYSTDKFTIV